MIDEHLENFIDMVTQLAHTRYHGKLMATFNNGIITIADRNDKVLLDNQNYKEYKDRIDNNLV